jgi:hypothetical protein
MQDHSHFAMQIAFPSQRANAIPAQITETWLFCLRSGWHGPCCLSGMMTIDSKTNRTFRRRA